MSRESVPEGWRLLSAARSGSLSSVKELLGRGVSANYQQKAGDASLEGSVFLKEANLEFTALFYAAEYGLVEIVEALLVAGADVGYSTKKTGATALRIASDPLPLIETESVVGVIKALLAAGAKLSEINGAGALCAAAAEGLLELAESIIKACPASINSEWGGRTAIFYAAEKNQTAMIEFLSTKGADVNYKDSCGQVPLHVAVNYSNVEAVRALLNTGQVVCPGVPRDPDNPLNPLPDTQTPLAYAAGDATKNGLAGDAGLAIVTSLVNADVGDPFVECEQNGEYTPAFFAAGGPFRPGDPHPRISDGVSSAYLLLDSRPSKS